MHRGQLLDSSWEVQPFPRGDESLVLALLFLCCFLGAEPGKTHSGRVQ